MKKAFYLMTFCMITAIGLSAQNTPLNQPAAGSYQASNFTYNTFTVNQYGLGWYTDPQTGSAAAYLTAYGGIKFFTSGVPVGIWNFSGQLGIGTLAPGDMLDVAGNPVFGAFPERLSMGSGSFGFNRRVATGTIYDNTHFAYQFQHTGSSTAVSDYLALQVYNTAGTGVTSYALSINGLGNVGIGTTDTKGYKFAVNGSVVAVSVNIKPYANWPDYVFKPTYKLPSLADVKTYIDKNQHLPEMPSAADVAKDGINVGQMNTLLTKKVEELTLYLLEKDKQLKEEEKNNHDQNEKLKELEDRIAKLENANK